MAPLAIASAATAMTKKRVRSSLAAAPIWRTMKVAPAFAIASSAALAATMTRAMAPAGAGEAFGPGAAAAAVA